jgi:hypothetical protein
MRRMIAAVVMASLLIGFSLPASADPASPSKQVVPLFGENTCTDPIESISGLAVAHTVVHRHVVNGEKRFIFKEHIARWDATGDSGTKYTGTASARITSVVEADGPTTIGETFKSRIISKGPAQNEIALIRTRTTINENGDVEVEVIDFEIKCTG